MKISGSFLANILDFIILFIFMEITIDHKRMVFCNEESRELEEQQDELINLKNVTINAFGDGEIIRLNITTNNAAVNKIRIDDNFTNCLISDNMFSQNINVSSFLIFPPLTITNPENPFTHGCKYSIILLDTNDVELDTQVFSIPKCLNGTCNCEDEEFRAHVKIVNVNKISDEIYEVIWTTQNKTKDKNLIEDVYFLYGMLNSPYMEATLVSWSKGDTKATIRLNHLLPGEMYVLKGEFGNKYKCRVTTKKQFRVPKNNVVYILMVIVAILSILLILSRIVKLKHAKKVLKYIKICKVEQNISVEEPLVLCERNPVSNLVTNESYIESISLNPDDKHEIQRSSLIIKKVIGKGAFGQVYLAKIKDIDGPNIYTNVAVKSLREHATKDEEEEFKKEILMLKRIGFHPNIVRLYGYCTLSQPHLIIMEFVPCGDLKKYLLDLREQWKRGCIANSSRNNSVFSSDGEYVLPESPVTPKSPASIGLQSIGTHFFPSMTESLLTHLETDSEPGSPRTPQMNHFTFALEKVLDNKELQHFALQIAKGMSHLERIGVTHRDLAARNILINESKTLKISDFGLSRAGPYVNSKSSKLPLRWMAIESIRHRQYNSKTDVWSFGVLLWEIATLGAFPYENDEDHLVLPNLMQGQRLSRPEICTDETYSLMLKCWESNPDDRPSFEELVELLDVEKRKVYVDFNQINPSYVFPPAKLERMSRELLNSISASDETEDA